MEPQKPSIGRIVHFHASTDAPPEAAIVMLLDGSAADGYTGSFWRWPPRA